ncbi:hypothetical protein SAMN04488093_10987 [Tropicibacter naphthalenivorans]|uniref:Uncharacterized protein n=1 Tax=Tropicibacter naphthalenivorans TaxID=441103 RepID=A0A0P1GHP1_9RHOB|nr:hypothetical protein TRN7648_03503 [Tropicibacter naphthalenivorans]SMD00110.1 hypothetical protein SAMN04488093_10987 [Tropicibacter naphthalenivorans]
MACRCSVDEARQRRRHRNADEFARYRPAEVEASATRCILHVLAFKNANVPGRETAFRSRSVNPRFAVIRDRLQCAKSFQQPNNVIPFRPTCPPADPSFTMRVCMLDLGVRLPRLTQARGARSPQIAQASGALELSVLVLERLQPDRLGHFHPAILGLQLVESRRALAMPSANLGCRHAGLLLFDHPDNLVQGLRGPTGATVPLTGGTALSHLSAPSELAQNLHYDGGHVRCSKCLRFNATTW